MDMETRYSTISQNIADGSRPRGTPLAVHLILFLLTLLTTTITGVLWQNDLDLAHIERGLPYSLSLLFILTCHEFGHFFAARFHKIRTTLPYYIPLPPITGISIGTMGAVIRMKDAFTSRKALFDIGIAGPIAGFVASIIVLVIGFATLPGKEFLLSIHPTYDFTLGGTPEVHPGQTLVVGSTLLYQFLAQAIPSAGAYVPPMTEMYHYPLLMAGWIGLFITSLNLLPVGQLDGGHIVYALSSRLHRTVARATITVTIALGLMSLTPLLFTALGATTQLEALYKFIPIWDSLFWSGWLVWSLFILFVIRVNHPHIEDAEECGAGRKALALFALVMLIVSFTPVPFQIY